MDRSFIGRGEGENGSSPVLRVPRNERSNGRALACRKSGIWTSTDRAEVSPEIQTGRRSDRQTLGFFVLLLLINITSFSPKGYCGNEKPVGLILDASGRGVAKGGNKLIPDYSAPCFWPGNEIMMMFTLAAMPRLV